MENPNTAPRFHTHDDRYLLKSEDIKRHKQRTLNNIALVISILAFIFALINYLTLSGCGNDSITNNPNPDPPHTSADSTIKLYSPLDSSHYFEGDSVHYSWSRGLGAYNYRFYSDSSAAFLQNDYSVITDTTIHGLIVFNMPSRKFIKIVPVINDTARFQYQSETRLIYFN